jgi:hypothetical protein
VMSPSNDVLLHDSKPRPPSGSPFPLEATDQTSKYVSITGPVMLKSRSVQTVPFEVQHHHSKLTRLGMFIFTALAKTAGGTAQL